MYKIFRLTGKLIAATIGFTAVIILIQNSAWAWSIFSEYPISELRVLEVNVKAETVVIMSPEGETATLTPGDVIGLKAFTITAINELIIEVESPPDDNGKITRSGIPTENFLRIEETFPEP